MTTIRLKAASCGIETTVVQQGILAVIPAEHCYRGWQQPLVLLGQLAEAEISG